MSRVFIISVVVFLIVCASFVINGDDNGKLGAVQSSASTTTLATPDLKLLRNPSLMSPFGSTAPTPTDQSDLIKKRTARMSKDGIMMPEKYFKMSVQELTDLGRGGDIAASIQLAERYWNEADTMQSEPGTDFSEPPRAVALRYYMLAVQGGAGNIPEIVANRLYQSGGDLTDAAAWDMVSSRFGTMIGGRYSGKSRSFSSLTYEQMSAADARAHEISP